LKGWKEINPALYLIFYGIKEPQMIRGLFSQIKFLFDYQLQDERGVVALIREFMPKYCTIEEIICALCNKEEHIPTAPVPLAPVILNIEDMDEEKIVACIQRDVHFKKLALERVKSPDIPLDKRKIILECFSSVRQSSEGTSKAQETEDILWVIIDIAQPRRGQRLKRMCILLPQWREASIRCVTAFIKGGHQRTTAWHRYQR
jgi:hypothetical protein